MFELLKIIFFSKVILLNNQPISFIGEEHIELKESISAINKGAHVNVIVTSMMLKYRGLDNIALLDKLEDVFPKGSMTICLENKHSPNKVCLDSISYAVNSDKMIVSFSTTKDKVLKGEYHKVLINSKITLENIYFEWVNHSK